MNRGVKKGDTFAEKHPEVLWNSFHKVMAELETSGNVEIKSRRRLE